MATLNYITSVGPSRSGAVHTATSASIGTADTNRRVIVTMTSGTFRSMSSATIGGVSASIDYQSEGNGFVAVFSAVVPTGTTATIVATMSGTEFVDARFNIYNTDDTTVDISSAAGYANGVASGTSNSVTYTGVTGAIKISSIGFANGGFKFPIELNGTTANDIENNAGSSNHIDSWSSGGTDAWTWDFTSSSARAVTFILPEASGGGSQELTPSLFVNTNTFYAPTVTVGSVTLSPALFANTNTFYSPVVSASYTLSPTLVVNNNTFYSPTVSAGAVTLTPSLFTNENTFYSPTVTLSGGLQTLSPNLFVNSNTFYSPTVTAGAVTLTPDIFVNTNTFYGATVNSTYTLTVPLYVNENTFYSPTVTVGAVTLQPELFVNENTFYSPTVSNANVVLYPELFVNENTFYSPTVTGGVRSQNGFVISDGFYFVNGKRIDVLPKDNRKTRRLKKAIQEVKQEQQQIKQLIAKSPKEQDKNKLELHSRMLDLRVKESEAVLNNALIQLAQTAFNAKQAYVAKKTNKVNKAKQQKEAEQLRIEEAKRQEEEQRQYQALLAEMAELEALQRQAEAKAAEEEDIIFIMTMLAA